MYNGLSSFHRRKSQIQTYLEQNEGAGLQHLALKTDDIFATVAKMRQVEGTLCGFELMARPSDGYFRELPERLGDKLTVSCITIFYVFAFYISKIPTPILSVLI
jgi:4-hydroxyphenylpyruvate dioxygenase-like putative hemolysin